MHRRRTVVLTGALGFIGVHAWAHLRERGYNVLAVDHQAAWAHPEQVRRRARALDLDPDEAHLGGVGTWRPPGGDLDAVIHLAGLGGAREGWGADLGPYLDRNVLALSQILAEVLNRTPRVFFASSSSVYGDGPLPSRENQPPDAVHPYACSKLAAEQLASMYARHHSEVEITALRLFTVYGFGQRSDMAFERFLRAGRSGDPIVVYGDGEQSRSFTYVADVTGVLERLVAATPRPGFSSLNVGNPESRTLNEAIAILQGLGATSGETVRRPAAIEPRGTACDVTLLHNRIGPVAWTPLEHGLPLHVERERALATTA